MNKHLANQIFDIVCKLTAVEHKAFQKHCKRKTPSSGKANHAYYELYLLYKKQKNDLDFNEKKIISEAEKFTGNLLDLNQKLNDELLNFLVINYRETEQGSVDFLLNKHIDTGIALYQKGLFSLALKSFTEGIEIFKGVGREQFNQDLLYLTIKLRSWVFNAKFKISNKEKINHRAIEDFEEFALPFFQLAYSSLKDKATQELFSNESFSQSTFFGLLNIYMRERKDFEDNYENKGSYPLFGGSFGIIQGAINYNASAEKAMQDIIDAESFVFQLERIYKAILANDKHDFESAVRSISQRLFSHIDKLDFNNDLLFYVHRQVLELKTIYTLKNNATPYNLKELKEFSSITKEKRELFKNDEIRSLAFRVELNTLVILFLEKDFQQIINVIEFYDGKYKKKESDYYLDVRLMDIISRIEIGGRFDEELDKKRRYYENYIKNYSCAIFHKKFNGFIKSYIDAIGKERQKEALKYLEKLETNMETFNHFHIVFFNWVKEKAKNAV